MASKAGVVLVLASLLGGVSAAAAVRVVGDWPRDLEARWQELSFEGNTVYRAAREGRASVIAVAEASASALYRDVEIDLTRTPYLQWSWRIDQLPALKASETAKPGDDFGARVYVVRAGLFGQLTASALNYVWSQQQRPGSHWRNPFTERAVMWSVQRGPQRQGEWVTHTRDLRADWRAAFGEEVERIDGIAIMTDADNSSSRAAARYGRIRFCATRDCTAD